MMRSHAIEIHCECRRWQRRKTSGVEEADRGGLYGMDGTTRNHTYLNNHVDVDHFAVIAVFECCSEQAAARQRAWLDASHVNRLRLAEPPATSHQ